MNNEVIVRYKGSELYFKINDKTTLKRVWNAYCQRNGYIYLFKHNGIIIPKEDYTKTTVELGVYDMTAAEASLK